MNWKVWAYWGGLLAGIQFLILTTLSMWFYNGGTVHKRVPQPYLFFENFFSDLGRTRTFTGMDNEPSHTLFTIALSVVGISLAGFVIAAVVSFRKIFPKYTLILILLFGLYSAWCYLGIAWVPWNDSYRGHVGFVRNGFISFWLMSVFYALAISSSPRYPNRYAWAFIIFIGLLAIQIGIMIFGPRSYTSQAALELQVFAQKIVVYAEIICMMYQSWGAMKVHKRLESRSA